MSYLVHLWSSLYISDVCRAFVCACVLGGYPWFIRSDKMGISMVH